jgi:hypothetical protein
LSQISKIRNKAKRVTSRAHWEKKLVNWLKEMDRRAKSLPKPQNNADYWLFWLVRYPWLQVEPLQELIAAELSYYEEMIASDKETARAAEGLSPKLRTQLAALIVDTRADLDDFFGKRQLKSLARRAQAQIKKLNHALRQAKSAVRNLHTCACKVHSHIGENAKVFAEESFGLLESIRVPTRDYINELPKYSDIFQPTKRIGLNTVQVFWFFHYGCKLTKAEAEVRTALIRNKFWSEWVDKIPVRLEYDGIESKGCESVCRAIRRFQN